MAFFLVFFLSVYTLMHAYFFWRVRSAFPGMGRWGLLLAAFLVIMILAPLLVHALDRARSFGLGRALGLIGYLWLAGLFWFCVLGCLVDGWNGGVRLIAIAAPAAKAAIAPVRPTLAVMLVVILAAGAWGWREAARITVREIVVAVEHLPAGLDSLRLAQVSDLHLGGPRSEHRLAETVAILRRLDPDLIVSTGDLVDSEIDNIAPLADWLGELRPRLGKFAVFGNHEFYAGVRDSAAFHEASGFRVLRGESVAPVTGLRIAGVDDPAGRRVGQGGRADESVALPLRSRGHEPVDRRLADANPGEAVVFLKHQPRIAPASVGRFDVQLSGHTHGGQIFPFGLVNALIYPLDPGRHDLADGSVVYVSRGTGTWGPPLRLASPPEVTVVVLKKR